MSKHTPGPWRAPMLRRGTNGNVLNNDGRPVAMVAGTITEAEQTSNARLIAAAPDMLAALESARSRMADIGCTVDNAPDFRMVAEAIAKAKGEDA